MPGAKFDWRHLGIEVVTWDSGNPAASMPTLLMVVPFWVLASVTAVPPALGVAVALRRRCKRRLAASGFCVGCGYDLATPTDARKMRPGSGDPRNGS